MSSKSTPYASDHSTNTVFLVAMLLSVVGGVFIVFALMALCYRRKSTMPKYDPPYVKKPMVKKFAGKGPSTHNPEEAALENVKRIISFGNMPSYREHKLQRLKRQGGMAVMGSASEEEAGHSGEEETVSFIDIAPNNLSKLPEKGILKKPGPYGTVESKEKWSEDSQSDNQEVMSQSDNNLESDGGPITEVERTLKSLNGYHEDILEALRNAASHRGTSATSLSDELRKSISDGYPEYASEFPLLKSSQEKLADSADEDTVPPCGPIRIRNLEDLIRQLEHHSSRHMSPSGSEDIRMSETEADRHYRLESASCTESQGCRREEEPRFVYGRYRHPTTSEDPAERLLRGAEGSMSAAYQEEEIYETADPDRGEPGGTPDSESDEFQQAQHLVRSASEEALPVTVKRDFSYERNLNAAHDKTVTRQSCEYYPSPPSEESYPGSFEDNASFPRRSVSEESRDSSKDTEETLLRPKRYPEYKH